MQIDEILIGVSEAHGPVARRITPLPTGVTVVPSFAGADAEVLARAVRETLASTERSTRDPVPFVRILLGDRGRTLTLADDGAARTRLLHQTGGSGGEVSLCSRDTGVGTAPLGEDAAIERLLDAVAAFCGASDPERLLVLLGLEGDEPTPGIAGSAIEDAYQEAHGRASSLAAQVRALDDRMTASVVPDWLWIATGFGGVGVFMTVVALLYPELRMRIVPILGAISVLGVGAYGWRAARELRLRAELQTRRSELRARRETAREEAATLQRALGDAGISPDEAVLRLIDRSTPAIPRVIAPRGILDPATLATRAADHRQTILWVDRDRLSPEIDRGLIQEAALLALT